MGSTSKIHTKLNDLAQLLEVTECTVYNWEVREVRPNGDSLDRLREIICGI
jgi:DNA-binding transcriptional regulator YiaG